MKFFLLLTLSVLSFSVGYPKATVLVTGCGRSGTTYTSKLFQAAGYDVHHEDEKGSFGTVSWFLVLPKDRNRKYGVVLHQIRNPIDTISSFTTAKRSSWNYISKRVPEINKGDSILTKSAKYWLYWNQLAEQHADYSYPIEDLPLHLSKINSLVGCQLSEDHIRRVDQHENTRNHHSFTWDDLKKEIDFRLYSEIVKYAEKWGYQTPRRQK